MLPPGKPFSQPSQNLCAAFLLGSVRRLYGLIR